MLNCSKYLLQCNSVSIFYVTHFEKFQIYNNRIIIVQGCCLLFHKNLFSFRECFLLLSKNKTNTKQQKTSVVERCNDSLVKGNNSMFPTTPTKIMNMELLTVVKLCICQVHKCYMLYTCMVLGITY